VKSKRLNVDCREDWLNAAILALRPLFVKRGYNLAEKIRVSCGWPARSKKAVGQCWSEQNSADGTFELFISPTLADSSRVLVHELCHVSVGIAEGHNSMFSKCAKALHLVGPWKATSAGPDFAENIFAPVLKFIGTTYPHASLTSMSGLSTGAKKQSARMLKCKCDECGYTVRTTAKWLEAAGAPVCPCNLLTMTCEEK